ncbi:MAG: hypothetical protein AAF211_03230 [Myxococcota bacterium]
MIAWLAMTAAMAEDPPKTSLHGDIKTFFVASFPDGLDNTGQGIADFRLKFESGIGDRWKFVAHHAITTFNVPPGAGLAGTNAGVGLQAPEFVDLTWQPDLGPGLTMRGRTDRLSAKYSTSGLDVTLGRQPVTFGSGLVFTPMDIVNPFSAAVIDTEYKPGVDSLRIDAYFGTSARITGIAAWAGPFVHSGEDLSAVDDVIYALNGTVTVGVTDLIGLVTSVQGEPVFGVGFISAIGPVGIHGDATLTLPPETAVEEDPFVRAVVGADWRPGPNTTLTAEAYYQGFGSNDPDDFFAIFLGPRFARGEVWQVGRWYASVAVAQEITPLLNLNVAVVGNLADPSMLLTSGLGWSIADDATLSAGIYAGIGPSPDFSGLVPQLRSEFGTYPPSGFLSVRTYF